MWHMWPPPPPRARRLHDKLIRYDILVSSRPRARARVHCMQGRGIQLITAPRRLLPAASARPSVAVAAGTRHTVYRCQQRQQGPKMEPCDLLGRRRPRLHAFYLLLLQVVASSYPTRCTGADAAMGVIWCPACPPINCMLYLGWMNSPGRVSRCCRQHRCWN
jgi:hypothetical protein